MSTSRVPFFQERNKSQKPECVLGLIIDSGFGNSPVPLPGQFHTQACWAWLMDNPRQPEGVLTLPLGPPSLPTSFQGSQGWAEVVTPGGPQAPSQPGQRPPCSPILGPRCLLHITLGRCRG